MSLAAAAHSFGDSLSWGSGLAQRHRGVDVALDVEVPGHVRATDPELERRGDDATKGVRRSHNDRGRCLVFRRAEPASVIGSDRNRQVRPEQLGRAAQRAVCQLQAWVTSG